MGIQPFQAESGGGVRTGTKGETRIEENINRIALRWFAPAWYDPELFTKAHRFEIIHPGPFPCLVFDYFTTVFR